LLEFAIRPLLVGVVLWPVRLRRNERLFIVVRPQNSSVLLGAFVVQGSQRCATHL
jgi:hypothetical protein